VKAIIQSQTNANYSQKSIEDNTSEYNSDKKSFKFNNKSVKDIVIKLLDSEISLGTDNAEELLNVNNLYSPVDVEPNMQIEEIIIIFDDDSNYEFGKIFLGNNNNKYYLQIENDGEVLTYELNENITNKNES
jgi:hypothetical protein